MKYGGFGRGGVTRRRENNLTAAAHKRIEREEFAFRAVVDENLAPVHRYSEFRVVGRYRVFEKIVTGSGRVAPETVRGGEFVGGFFHFVGNATEKRQANVAYPEVDKVVAPFFSGKIFFDGKPLENVGGREISEIIVEFHRFSFEPFSESFLK